MKNTDNGTLINNTCSDNTRGIQLNNNCNNNSIFNSKARTSVYMGIVLSINCSNNIILGNTAYGNTQHGIYLVSNSNKNTISGNIVYSNGDHGIYLLNEYDNNTISENTAYSNGDNGIYLLNECDNNTISGNTAYSNGDNGIYLDNHCDGNTISGNTANDNELCGIDLDNNCNNIVSGNIVTNNVEWGIYLYTCDNNIIWGNTVSNIGTSNQDFGIFIRSGSDNNTISGNTANDNRLHGIYLDNNCNNNTILGNTANNNADFGIRLYNNCNNNTILGNTVNGNHQYGIELSYYCTNNTILENVIHYNYQYGMVISISCYSNLIYLNEFKNQYNARDDGNNKWDNGTIGNYWDDYEGVDADDNGIGDTPYDVPPAGGSVDNFPIWEDGIDIGSLHVEVFDQIFTEESFNITFFIHNSTNFGIEFASVQVWWNGVDVSADVQNLSNGYYFISLDSITVTQGEDPILFNMTVSASGYEDKYFEIYIVVYPSDLVEDTLEFEIIDQSFSTEQFNITFFIYNTTGDGIDFATFKIWWNDIDVSADVQNLGNGYYFISLDPITVTQGEDPILLKMIISASGYEDKQYETYLAVDPDTLEKEVGKGAEEAPLVIIIIAIL